MTICVYPIVSDTHLQEMAVFYPYKSGAPLISWSMSFIQCRHTRDVHQLSIHDPKHHIRWVSHTCFLNILHRFAPQYPHSPHCWWLPACIYLVNPVDPVLQPGWPRCLWVDLSSDHTRSGWSQKMIWCFSSVSKWVGYSPSFANVASKVSTFQSWHCNPLRTWGAPPSKPNWKGFRRTVGIIIAGMDKQQRTCQTMPTWKKEYNLKHATATVFCLVAQPMPLSILWEAHG